MTINIYKDQLKRMPRQTIDVIRFAVKRYKTGEIMVRNARRDKNRTLVPFAVKKRFGMPDELLRAIIDAHLDNPRDYSKELKVLNLRVELMMAELPEFFYVDLEEDNELL